MDRHVHHAFDMVSNRWAWILVAGATLLGAGGCGSEQDDSAESGGAAIHTGSAPIATTDAQRKDLAEKKATCPFVGAAVYLKKLDVLGTLSNPLARISDIAALGDEGGGNLGSVVLSVFARGNQHRMRGATGDALTVETPSGLFSLDFPMSQGSHPGHSGILEQGPTNRYHGALDRAALARLVDRAVDVDGRAKGEPGFKGAKYIKRSDVGAFIWDNVSSDPNSVYLFHGLGVTVVGDLRSLHREPSVEKIVKLSGTDNLVGSAGEFGLLMTLLEQPGTNVDGEPVILVDDVNMMFVEKKLPATWNQKRLTAVRWVENTMALLLASEGDRFSGLF